MRMNHHPHLKGPVPFPPDRVDRVPAAVRSAPAAVRSTLVVGVLEHHCILCHHHTYLVAVSVATLAAAAAAILLESRNYQEEVLHSFAGMGTRRHGCPVGVGHLDIHRQGRVGSG